jgi:hypothetical protein
MEGREDFISVLDLRVIHLEDSRHHSTKEFEVLFAVLRNDEGLSESIQIQLFKADFKQPTWE